MASRPRPGGLKAPVGTKRGAAALRPPSGSGVRKQSPLPSGSNRSTSRTPVKSATPSGAAGTDNGQQDFQVGDRVIVNGKPGTLAFLGSTLFAKGVWAGIVLDTKEGKNNGAVNGVQYFECEANRGLFSRLEKLAVLEPSSAAARVNNQVVSISSPAHAACFEVGDRVSIDGVKEGDVAFVGETQFAIGLWVGIVLDGPDGKNNGSVVGVQYFECEANYGLFAKPEKLAIISKSKSLPHASSSAQSSALPGQFDVGDRVLVEGLKEGVIGFLGQTQFARGVWVGIILDVPEGKNNGTVNDVQYFSCEPNHGLFTKLNKLQLISRGSTGGPAKTPVQDNGDGGRLQSDPVTPVDLKILQDKLSVGDHVLVSGVKEGVLRFIGPTEFAKGIWVGVELPAPMGKNDGAVSGKRYFQCEPKHGLFAPLPKVEKLASAGSEGGLSNNPSLASLSVSPSPHASPKGAGFLRSARAQEQARKKHMGLAVDTGRSDSSVSSRDSSRISQEPGLTDGYSAEAAETLETLNQLVHERDEELESLHAALEDREQEKQAHQEELTELRRQVDDLQFQLEEQNVISGDQLETVAESSTNQLTVISRQLEDEKKANTQLHEQIQALQSDEEDKCSSLQNELTEQQATLQDRELQASSYEATIADLREQLGQAVSSGAAEDLGQSQLQAELAESQTNLEAERHRLTSLEQQLTDSNQNLQEVGAQCNNLRKELEQTKADMQEESQKAGILEQELGDTVTLAGELQADLEKCQRELEKTAESCSQRDAELEQKAGEMAASEDKMRHVLKEQELWSSERSRLVADQERLIGERDQAMLESSRGSTEQARLNQLMQERDSLLTHQQALQTDNDRLLSDREELLHQVEELQQQRQAVLEASQHTNLQFSSTQGELSQTRNELQQAEMKMTSAREEWEEVRLSLTEQMELAKVDTSESQRQAITTMSERDSALQKAQELVERLEKAESERDGLQLDLETAQVQVEELQFELDELNTRHGSVLEEGNAEFSQVQENLVAMEIALEEKDRELAIAQEKVHTLTDDLVACQGTRDLAMMEEEKALLEERVKELILQLEKSQDKREFEPSPLEYQSETLSGRLEEAQRQLLEAEASQQNYLQEIDDLNQQTEFLNSVIVDLQNKLEGVEAMKGLHGHLGSVSDYAVDDDDDDDEMQVCLPPPRIFCDICDIFDEHDTDDCPLQATSSDSPPHSMNEGARAPGGSDRPYCNTCEIFGHWTEDCEYEATY